MINEIQTFIEILVSNLMLKKSNKKERNPKKIKMLVSGTYFLNVQLNPAFRDENIE